VLKAGFLGSGRYGNGIVVARLSDGTWSAPSAIGLGGAGFGGQIGFELTDFVFVLNDAAAVRAFSQQGSLTLGGNVSLAAGPIGRNAEAAGAASLKGVAGVFSYSKTKGLFAGVSLEGSAIVERRDANEKLYGQRYTASQLMEGSVRPPPAAASLMSVLNSRVFAGVGGADDSMYNDVPQYDDRHDDVVWEGRRGSGYGEGVRRDRGNSHTGADDDYTYSDKPKRASTWADDVYDRPAQGGVGRGNSLRNNNRTSGFDDDYTYSDTPTSGKAGPGRPAAPKPAFAVNKTGNLEKDQAVALFTFEADQSGDLGFKKGEIITVTKKTDKAEDWW
jgi:SH3 domain-containing YSC84-like protein 1